VIFRAFALASSTNTLAYLWHILETATSVDGISE
jgi:hypothetical protein